MTPDREEVLRMARESGFIERAAFNHADALERFYALAYEAGARAERETTETIQPMTLRPTERCPQCGYTQTVRD